MHLLWIACLSLLAQPETPRTRARPKPVAMVLEAGPGATLRRADTSARPLGDMDLLLPGDRLEAGKESVTLVVLADGYSEQLAPGKSVTVGERGCMPAEAVERHPGRLSPANLRVLRRLANSNRGGVGVIRGTDDAAIPPVSPLFGSTVLNRRPTLSWPTIPDASGYEVRLYSGQGRDRKLEWQATTVKHVLPYPEKQPDLPPGVVRHWEVTAQMRNGEPREVWKSRFSVAAQAEARALERLKPLAEGKDPAGWLLAALTYGAYGAYDEALPLYERLARDRPGQASYQAALASYYDRAGLRDRAEQARKRAEALKAGQDRK